MKCNFCGREVSKGTQECPYCHYRFEQEATVLNPRERDDFDGVTIDESGYEETGSSNNGRTPEYRESYEYRREEYGTNRRTGPKIYVKNMGCGGGLLGILLIICILIALFIFFMPLFIVVAAVGVVYYLISSILGGF